MNECDQNLYTEFNCLQRFEFYLKRPLRCAHIFGGRHSTSWIALPKRIEIERDPKSDDTHQESTRIGESDAYIGNAPT